MPSSPASSTNINSAPPPSVAPRARAKKKFLWLLLLVLALSLAGVWAWRHFQKAPAATAKKSSSGTSREAQPLKLQGLKVRPVVFAETITASGTLRAEESVEIQTEVSGKVVAINFTEGQPVKAGDVLVKIDDSTLQASLRRTQVRREIAVLREQRLANLVEDGGVSKQDFDEARSSVAIQDAEAELIRSEIAKTEIRAPFDGVAGLRFISLGAYVSPSTRIATLQRVNRLKVDFSVPERYATVLKPGVPITFTVAGNDTPHRGEVYAIEPRIDVATRTVLLRARCENPDLALIPGVFARIELAVSKSDDAILIPAHALLSGLEERFVFRVRDGKAERVSVRTGARTSSQIQIIEGLSPGDVVITSGVQQLRAGLPVAVDLGS